MPCKHEIDKAVQKRKNRKAPRPDGIPPKAIRADPEKAIQMLLQLLGQIWDEERVPTNG